MKKNSNKSCWNFHFLEKTPWAHIGLNAEKNIDYMKKFSKLFCRKWKSQEHLYEQRELESQQILFEPFFHIIGMTSSIEPQSQPIFPFPLHYNTSNMPIFRVPSLNFRRRQTYAPPWLFCRKFNSKQLLLEAFFRKIGIFRSVQPWSKYNLSFLFIIFQPYQSSEPHSSTSGRDRHVCPLPPLWGI